MVNGDVGITAGRPFTMGRRRSAAGIPALAKSVYGAAVTASGRGNRMKGRTFGNDDGFKYPSLGALYGDVVERDADAGTCMVAGEGGVPFPARYNDDVAVALGIA